MKNHITSYTTSLVPFIENDDATRLQMSSNQIQQSLPLANAEIPLVQTGYENIFHSFYTHYARKRGQIDELTLNNGIIIYEDNDYDLVDTNWKMLPRVDKESDMYITNFEPGDITIKDIMSENGVLKYGKNLLTMITPYYGYNYEDAIIISENIVSGNNKISSYHMEKIYIFVHQNEVLVSLSKDGYDPLPKTGTTLKKDDVIAIIKEIDYGQLSSLFKKPITEKFEKDNGIVYELKLYPNVWDKSIRDWDLFVKRYLDKIDNALDEFLEKYKDIFDKDDLLKFIYRNKLDIAKQAKTKRQHKKFKYKKDFFPGIIIELTILYTENLNVGDKFANRHGNKGVVSTIIAEKDLPRLEDGRTPDIIINPLGIISRMNIGQLKELYLATLVDHVKKIMMDELGKGNIDKVKNIILDVVGNLDNTKTKWVMKQTKDQLENITPKFLKSIVENFYVIQPPFESASFENIKKLMIKYNSTVHHKIFDPISKKTIANSANGNGILCGYMYWMKLLHMAKEKFSARSISTYSYKTMQPIGGRKNNGGQRFGEMETWCLAAYDALYNLDETMTIKSDAIDQKYKYIANTLKGIKVDEYVRNNNKKETETYNLLKNYLRIIGTDLVDK